MDELVKVISSVSWPHVSLLFAIIFIFAFKPQLSSVLSRITSVSKDGIKTGIPPDVQYDERRKKEVDQLMQVGDSLILLQYEEAIKKDLILRGLEVTGDSISVLIRHLAATQITLAFEQTYNNIYGSQIFLLKHLNNILPQGLTTEFINGHFQQIVGLFPDNFKDWNLDLYLSFLIRSKLIRFAEGKYYLTDFGVEFLVWLAKTGRTENRPL